MFYKESKYQKKRREKKEREMEEERQRKLKLRGKGDIIRRNIKNTAAMKQKIELMKVKKQEKEMLKEAFSNRIMPTESIGTTSSIPDLDYKPAVSRKPVPENTDKSKNDIIMKNIKTLGINLKNKMRERDGSETNDLDGDTGDSSLFNKWSKQSQKLNKNTRNFDIRVNIRDIENRIQLSKSDQKNQKPTKKRSVNKDENTDVEIKTMDFTGYSGRLLKRDFLKRRQSEEKKKDTNIFETDSEWEDNDNECYPNKRRSCKSSRRSEGRRSVLSGRSIPKEDKKSYYEIAERKKLLSNKLENESERNYYSEVNNRVPEKNNSVSKRKNKKTLDMFDFQNKDVSDVNPKKYHKKKNSSHRVLGIEFQVVNEMLRERLYDEDLLKTKTEKELNLEQLYNANPNFQSRKERKSLKSRRQEQNENEELEVRKVLNQKLIDI